MKKARVLKPCNYKRNWALGDLYGPGPNPHWCTNCGAIQTGGCWTYPKRALAKGGEEKR